MNLLEDFHSFFSIPVLHARNLLHDPTVRLIDIRTPYERTDTGIIPWSLLLDFSNPTFEHAIKKLDPNYHYLLICRSASRTKLARQLMRDQWLIANDIAGGIIKRPDPLSPYPSSTCNKQP